MPLGKYYCDYCDKQFQDTPAARRRHLQGSVHQRAKALWYDSLRSSSQIGLDDLPPPGKGVCNRFIRTGSCQYGDSCKYYHPKKSVANQEREGTSEVSNVQYQGIGSQHGEASLPPATVTGALFANRMGSSVGNLPPSLWPPPEGGYPPLAYVDWG